VFVVVAVGGLDEGKAGQGGAVREIGEIGRQRRDVIGIDAEVVEWIADHAGRLSGAGAGGLRWVLIEICVCT
jgi:hypothetical protein